MSTSARQVKPLHWLATREGDEHTVPVAWRDPEGPSFVTPRALLTFETRVEVELRSYKVSELCNLLTGKTDSRAKFTAGNVGRSRVSGLLSAFRGDPDF